MGGEGSGMPKAALLRLDGTQIDEDGNISKTDFFSFLNTPAERFLDLQKTMTPEQALKFRNHIIRMTIGVSAAIPKLCAGERCPVEHCPLHDDGGVYPISEPCPLESNLVAMWTKSYIEDLGVNIESRSEMILINKLVECDIIDYRANLGLSMDEEGWTLLKTDTTTSDRGVTEITNTHPLLEAKERAHKERVKVLESLAATRKEQYKRAAALKKREEEDIGTHFNNLKKALQEANHRAKGQTIEQLKADAEKMSEEDNNIQDADWTTDDKL